MAIPQRELRILFQKSGNRCAFPNCWRLLTAEASALDPVVNIGEVAHIVAEQPDGPRGESPLTHEERNRYDNLVLLCHQHHQLIDDQPQTYTVARLAEMRRTHEERVEKALRQGIDGRLPTEPARLVSEAVFSTLLPIEHLPAFVYHSPCRIREERELREHMRPPRNGECAPAILREGRLFAFQDLRDRRSPFSAIVDRTAVSQERCEDWWRDEDRSRWFVALMYRALNKLTGWKGLNLDKRHRRYFFQPPEANTAVEVEYQPLNQKKAKRTVVWQPKSKRTGESRGFWYHRAVSLQLLNTGKSGWCLNLRPELHVTKDGMQRIESDRIGSRVTKKKSRMFNYDLLGEIQFWRDFLGGSSPRIVLRFGPYERQYLVIRTNLMEGTVAWPGIPAEHAKPFRNVEYVDDLFSWAEYERLDSDTQVDDWDDDESDDSWQDYEGDDDANAE